MSDNVCKLIRTRSLEAVLDATATGMNQSRRELPEPLCTQRFMENGKGLLNQVSIQGRHGLQLNSSPYIQMPMAFISLPGLDRFFRFKPAAQGLRLLLGSF